MALALPRPCVRFICHWVEAAARGKCSDSGDPEQDKGLLLS